MTERDYGDPGTVVESVEESNQLQPGDTLDDRGVDDILDEGIVTRERWSPAEKFGNTAEEIRRGETLDQRIAQEEPEPQDAWDSDGTEDDGEDHEVGGRRSGRLVMSDEAHHDDRFATDAGIDGAAASAEEAAMHVIDEDEDS
jgi:hypothetical protein